MNFKNLAKILVIGLLILFSANTAFAGFGVSPPKILNNRLLPGSHFEQTIYLVQSKPEKDLLATVEIDSPEAKNWISIDRGLEFIIPAGVQMFPIKVSIDVPIKAALKHYSGRIWIKTAAKTEEGTVSIGLGALIDIDLTVSAESVYGFVFRGWEVLRTEEERPIKIEVSLENTGNIKDRPTKIHLVVYDRYQDKVLYSGDATKFKYIKPFTVGAVTAKFRAKLAIGTYWAVMTVYKGDNVIVEDRRVFQVVERTGLLYKIFSHWYSWVISIIIIAVGLGWVFRKKLKEWYKKWTVRKREKKKAKLEKKLKRYL